MDELQIRGLEPIIAPSGVKSLPSQASGNSQGFAELLRDAVEAVNHLQHEAGRLEDAVAKGENMNIHQAIIAGEKAGLSFRLMMQVRNKMLEAYEQVMRMQV